MFVRFQILYERVRVIVELLVEDQEMYLMTFDEECSMLVELNLDLNIMTTELLYHWQVSLLMHSMMNH